MDIIGIRSGHDLKQTSNNRKLRVSWTSLPNGSEDFLESLRIFKMFKISVLNFEVG